MSRHPARAFRAPVLAALVALTALSGCATLAGTNYYSVEEEWQLGQQLETQLGQELRLANDPLVTGYVREMGQRMVRAAGVDNLPWRFYVVRDDAVNAFNVPGGLVYVNTGLIENVGSAGELAGAIAHEVAHGVERHGTQRLSKSNETNAIAGMVLGRNPGAVTQIATQIAAQGAFASFSRADEREADAVGVRVMAEAGYDPEGLAQLLERLAAEERGGGIALLRSHPLSSERMQTVRQLARPYDGRDLRLTDGRFSAVRRRAAQL
ncbi:M48 family metallopeptidase [Rubrivirga litoralis]|uniref:M48 family metallopeptidase n=1 Tax=Rubrivirga litoralis TaxID=3075598 RepID=A0ABU3BPI6_9BACT|nr:M48 family metallopeptidase [Rubrivirga sp. F394]MDT0631173.1 M48 family metallopeptidase [Rubrivirga sp. F394]